MAEQNFSLKQEIASLTQNNFDQVRELKLVNEDLKRKFEIIQI